MRAPSIALAVLAFGAVTALAPVAAQTTEAPANSPSPAAPAPAPPDVDLYVADLVRSGATGSEESWRIERPRNLTKRSGYDNQPSYLPDGQHLLYTSQRGGQTDIYELDLATATERQVTNTPESEYSPQLAADERSVIVVRVEPDGTQRLWSFPFDRGSVSEPTPLFPDLKGVGYHAWLDASTVVTFVLGEPFTLQVAEAGGAPARVVASAIGRSIHRVPGQRAVSFTAPDGPPAGTTRAIFELDPATGVTRRIAPAPPTEEGDYAWTPDGALLASVGTTIHRLRPGIDAGWVPIADFAGDGVGKISRLAVSPMGNQISFVAER